jgi:hypothetical protein
MRLRKGKAGKVKKEDEKHEKSVEFRLLYPIVFAHQEL